MALKVLAADQSTTHNRELEVLQRIKEHDHLSHPGRKHISQLLDSFYHEGPNGRHLCVVMELLGPSAFSVAERSQNYRLDGNLARRVSRQLLYATQYLHYCGIAHGGRSIPKRLGISSNSFTLDIHTGNVLFRLGALDSWSRQKILDIFGHPRKGEVSRKDGKQLEKGLPEYLVEPAEYKSFNAMDFSQVQLIDFGQCESILTRLVYSLTNTKTTLAFFISSPPPSINTPMSLHPPELVFKHILSEAVDLWNLGCTVSRNKEHRSFELINVEDLSASRGPHGL